jgi:Flp pilus assembly protein TadG
VAAAEFAVCLPIVVLLLLGAIEACSMIFLKQSLSIAAYEGARTGLSSKATAADVQTVCGQIFTDRRIDGGTVSISPDNFDTVGPGVLFDVVTTAPCDGNTVLPNMFYRGRQMSAVMSMMTEQ